MPCFWSYHLRADVCRCQLSVLFAADIACNGGFPYVFPPRPPKPCATRFSWGIRSACVDFGREVATECWKGWRVADGCSQRRPIIDWWHGSLEWKRSATQNDLWWPLKPMLHIVLHLIITSKSLVCPRHLDHTLWLEEDLSMHWWSVIPRCWLLKPNVGERNYETLVTSKYRNNMK